MRRFSSGFRLRSGFSQLYFRKNGKAVGRVRNVVGPILTTGVSLVTAGIVVANPIMAPRADIAIPAVQLSAGNSETIGMLDQAFLDAIAPGPAGSSNPFSVLKDLITGLAADATSRGKNAMVDAFVAGVAAVSQPELTAFSYPYIAPPVLAPPVGFPLGLPARSDSDATGLVIAALMPAIDITDVLTGPDSVVVDVVWPVVRDFVTTIAADVEYVGSGLVAAAFAAGALVAYEPILIARTLTALINGDFEGALANAIKALVAPLGPPAMVYDTLRNVVVKHLTPSPRVTPPAAPAAQLASLASGPQVSATDIGDSPSPTARNERRHRNDAPPALPPDADAVSASVSDPDAVAAGTDRGLAGAVRKAVGHLRDAIGAADEHGDGQSSAGADVSVAAVADAPVPAVADGATPPAVSDGPAESAGRGQAARYRR